MTNSDAGGLLGRDIIYTLSEACGWPPPAPPPPAAVMRRAPYVVAPPK